MSAITTWRAIRPAVFNVDPERAHGLSLTALRLASGTGVGRAALRGLYRPRRADPVTVFGLRFPHVVGLAAGYDKDALAWRGLACLGFSHVEIGTVTPRPQTGNAKPRVFRLPEDRGVINRLGFPSRGMEFVAARLEGPRPDHVVLGVNIGKNKETPLAEAANDYLAVMERLYTLCDYVAVNVSSPNTPGLRELQGGDYLGDLLSRLVSRRDALVSETGQRRPLLVKIAPDLEDEALAESVAAIIGAGVDGVISSNTTIARDGLQSPNAGEAGGLSGAPLTDRSTERLGALCRMLDGAMPVIGVGGIMDAQDAAAKLQAGASLVQLYTGMIYAGPSLPGEIAGALARNTSNA